MHFVSYNVIQRNSRIYENYIWVSVWQRKPTPISAELMALCMKTDNKRNTYIPYEIFLQVSIYKHGDITKFRCYI